MFIINARAPVHMRRALWAVLLLALAAAPAAAHTTHEFKRGCIASLPLVLDNATLYRQECMSMNQSVTAWNYSAAPAETHPNCVLVSYNASVESLYPFPNLPMRVSKSVCLSDQVVVESARINVSSILYLEYTSRNEVGDNQMNFTTQMTYGIPYLFLLLNYYIERHIEAKLRQHFAAWYAIICMQAPFAITFSNPQHKPAPEPAPEHVYGITPEDLLTMLFR